MALRRNVEPAAPAAPAVEIMPEPATAAEVAEVAAPTPEPQAQAAPPAVATQKQNMVPATPNVVFEAGLLYDELRDKFIAPYGSMPVLKASNGNVLDNENKLLGSWIEFQILSFNDNFVVSPCAKEAPKKLVRYSRDNVTFNDGTGDTVADHLNNMKSAGWVKAESRHYMDMVVFLKASEQPSPHVGKMVSIQLSPTSRTAFEAFRGMEFFQLQLGMSALNKENPYLLRAKCKVVSADANTWTKLEFSAAETI